MDRTDTLSRLPLGEILIESPVQPLSLNSQIGFIMADEYEKRVYKPTLQMIADFERNHAENVAKNVKGACTYGCITADGVYHHAHNACHSGVGYPFSAGYLGQLIGPGLPTPGVNKKTPIVAWVNADYHKERPKEEIHPLFYDWVGDRDHSPWRRLIRDDYYFFRPTPDVGIRIVGNMSESGQLICSFLKASRIFTEYPTHGRIFNALVENGVHPTIAFVLSQITSSTNGETVSWVGANWHGSVVNTKPTLESLKELWLEGKPQVDRFDKTYGLSHKGGNALYGGNEYTPYAGVDEIFDKYGTDLSRLFQDKFPNKTVSGRFSGPTVVPNNRIETLVEFSFYLQQELKVTDYANGYTGKRDVRLGEQAQGVHRQRVA